MNLTRILADYVLSLKYENLPPEVISEAKVFFCDTLGCMLAGANEPTTEIAIDYAKAFAAASNASIIGRRSIISDEINAAIANGVAVHVHDYDDQLPPMNGHPSAPVLPAILAYGQAHNTSGKDILMAYIAGVEVNYLMSLAFNKKDRYYSKGWHTTSTLGVFAATAAIGRLMGLTSNQMVHALGIAASESSGLKGNFGTMTKSLHAGRAAAKGIYCARMASMGYKSNPAIIEVSEGLAYATIGEADTQDVIDSISEGRSAFTNPGLNMKAWPCCKQNHSAINSVQTLQEKHQFTADDIDRIHCRVQPVQFDCLKYSDPKTSLQGKFSINYNVALTVLKGSVRLSDFDQEYITDSQIIDLMHKIQMTVDMDVSGGSYNNGKFDCIVDVYLKDGRTLSERTVDVKGDFMNKMPPADTYDKFYDCASRAIAPEAIPEINKRLFDLDNISDISDFIGFINENALN